MSILIKPPCCNDRPDEKKPIYNGDNFVMVSPAPKWEVKGYDVKSLSIPNKEKFVLVRYWTPSSKNEVWGYEDFAEFVSSKLTDLNDKQVEEVVTLFAAFVSKETNFNGDLVEQIKALAPTSDNTWSVEAIYEAFCQVIEDSGDTPWADSSYNDRMREAHIIYEKLQAGEKLDVYDELFELIAIYDEDDE